MQAGSVLPTLSEVLIHSHSALTGSSSETERLGFVLRLGISPVRDRPLRWPFFFSPSDTAAVLVPGLPASLVDVRAGATAAEAPLALPVAIAGATKAGVSMLEVLA